MYISSRVDQKERSYKVAVCMYISYKRKEVIKLRYVCIYHEKEKSDKVAVGMYIS